MHPPRNKIATPKISITYESVYLKTIIPFSRREIRLLLEEMSRELTSFCPAFSGCLQCVICADAYIENLNQSFLNTPGPTNTLSFEAMEPCRANTLPPAASALSSSPMPLTPYAQLYFCAPQFKRELILYGQNPDDYAIFLLAHAMTHLAGLDHGEEMDLIAEQLVLAGKNVIYKDRAIVAQNAPLPTGLLGKSNKESQ